MMQTLATQRLVVFGKAASALLKRHFLKRSSASAESNWIKGQAFINRSRNMSFLAQAERDTDGFWYYRICVRTGTGSGNYRFEHLNTPREAFINWRQALKAGEYLAQQLATLRYRFQ
ncbi:hypothetical protein IMY97_18905 [Pectobacterium versatile]|uniref:hypothetical protein n=1 Tax=Pectobacterium versatile TaxID=2488639 RepID=UPI0016613413|nr:MULTISPECIES: hypothetical protein [Pectobacterium]QUI36700.2 hypothetical protein IMY97_18905 [Pectobacterium versatile]